MKGSSRKRAAIAPIDAAVERATHAAYRVRPLGALDDDLDGWDSDNALARALASRGPKKPREPLG